VIRKRVIDKILVGRSVRLVIISRRTLSANRRRLSSSVYREINIYSVGWWGNGFAWFDRCAQSLFSITRLIGWYTLHSFASSGNDVSCSHHDKRLSGVSVVGFSNYHEIDSGRTLYEYTRRSH